MSISVLVHRLLLSVGGVVLFGLAVFIYRSDRIIGSAADRLLTNARAPLNRQMPPTAHSHSYASGDIQILGGHGEELSCSIPSALEWLAFSRPKGEASVSLQMRQACVFHDYCYRHGAATYGYSQADCDYLLLDHAYRICRFVYRTDPGREFCITTSRKVVIGVRLGGNAHFRTVDYGARPTPGEKAECPPADALIDRSCASSYFEFDPYPVRATEYSIYRIADAPKKWVEAGSRKKALYVFQMKPSGSQLLMTGWVPNADKNGGQTTLCAGINLPGDFSFLTTAPQIGARPGPGGIADWFVWWKRKTLEKTEGRLDILSPAQASLGDWARIFPGATDIGYKDCDRPMAADLANTAVNSTSVFIGIKGAQEENKFSEIHPSLLLQSEGKIPLYALRTNHCGQATANDDSGNALCFLDIQIDPSLQRQPQEPYVARDPLNLSKQLGGPRIDPDRYRNFSAPPLQARGWDRPVVMWLRRGEGNGAGYADSAVLRRVTSNGSYGCNAGPVRLIGFNESSEPAAVLDRTSLQPSIVALSVDGSRSATIEAARVIFSIWKLPMPIDLASAESRDLNCGERRVRSTKLAERELTPVKPKVVKCYPADGLTQSWIVRPPVVLGSPLGTSVYFTRVINSSTTHKGDEEQSIALQVRKARLSPATGCIPETIQVFALPHRNPFDFARKAEPLARGTPTRTENELKAAHAFARLRRSPTLIADLDGQNKLSVVLPDTEKPSSSKIFGID